ncbi:MAG: trypsin-like peptidase domain-containing protein [Ignavibacterium sp.]
MIFNRDNLYKVVCNIRIPLTGGREEIGTGMFIVKDNKPIILTASHVITNSNDLTYLIISDANNNPQKILLKDLINTNTWIKHNVADLAYIEITPTTTNQNYLQGRFFPYDHIEVNDVSPSKDVELTSIGFPLGLGTSGKYSPLTFRTFASSSIITLNRFDNNLPSKFFILENPSIGGYSGGPIFDLGYLISGLMTQTKEKTICFGFTHGTISDQTGGKLGAITPASYLNGWI